MSEHLKRVAQSALSEKKRDDWDHLVYIRLFEGCDLRCEHCFIPSNPKKIDLEFYKNGGIGDELLKSGKVREGEKIYLQWHGGEPTLLGKSYLEEAISETEKDERFAFSHGIQTNMMSYLSDRDGWRNLYHRRFGSEVGASWDYGIRRVKSSSLTDDEAWEEFDERFWKAAAAAMSDGLNLYLVVTATKLFFKRYSNPFEFFEQMSSRGIRRLNFERITETGSARKSWRELGLNNAEYSWNMKRFMKAYCAFKESNSETDFSVSPFDGLLESAIRLRNGMENAKREDAAGIALSFSNQGYGCWSGKCDSSFHTIDANGYKRGCTALNSEEDNKNAILPKRTIWMKAGISAAREERRKTCEGCAYSSICSSGCLTVSKFDESGECSGAKGLFDEAYSLAKTALSD